MTGGTVVLTLCAAIRVRSCTCSTSKTTCNLMRSGLFWATWLVTSTDSTTSSKKWRFSKSTTGGWSQPTRHRLASVPVGCRTRLRQSSFPLRSGASLLPHPFLSPSAHAEATRADALSRGAGRALTAAVTCNIRHDVTRWGVLVSSSSASSSCSFTNRGARQHR